MSTLQEIEAAIETLPPEKVKELASWLEAQKWMLLRRELKPGLDAPEGEFAPLQAEDILAEARSRKRGHAD